MSEELTCYDPSAAAAIMERVLLTGDLEKLTPQERVSYYMQVCESLGLNPLTRPFDYLKMKGGGDDDGERSSKMVLYARKDCTDQLRAKHNVSFDTPMTSQVGDVYIVSITARMPNGRTDADIGAVSVKGFTGKYLANAIMRAITKAKRRATLSICGLGWMDESERDTLPGAACPIRVDLETGEILETQGEGFQTVEMGKEEMLSPERPETPNGGGTPRMTEPQHRAIEALIGKAGLDRERVRAWLVAERLIAPGGHLTELSRKTVSAMIDRWDDVLHRYQEWMMRQEGDA